MRRPPAPTEPARRKRSAPPKPSSMRAKPASAPKPPKGGKMTKYGK